MEKTTKYFEEDVQAYLDKVAETDPVFKEKLTNEKFKIEECVNYILNTVKKANIMGYTDREVFGMSKHYVDEYLNEKFDVSKVNMNVVVNHTVELTPKEIEEAKEKAREKILDEAREKMTKRPKKKVAKVVTDNKEKLNKPVTQSSLLF